MPLRGTSEAESAGETPALPGKTAAHSHCRIEDVGNPSRAAVPEQ
jgi:hypothetical protein